MTNEKTKQQKFVKYEVFQDRSEFTDQNGYTVGRSCIDLPSSLEHISLLFKAGTNPIDVLQALKSLENRIQSEIVKGYEYQTYGKYNVSAEESEEPTDMSF